jgi:SNF2 family DNA or RNA helicase
MSLSSTQKRSNLLVTQQKRYDWINSTYKRRGVRLRDYQQYGIKWMLRHEEDGHGGLLGDEPGLGKTFQSLALAISSKGKTLIVVPSSILMQWEQEAIRFSSNEKVYIHHASKRRFSIPEKTKIVLTTPATLLISDRSSRFVDLQSTFWTRIIVDEIHIMKNKSSKISKCLMEMSAQFKWGLTGTPVQNKEKETTNLFRFIHNNRVDDKLNIDLEFMLKNRFLRRTKIDNLDLKTVVCENEMIDFETEEERTFYHKIRKDVREEFMNLELLHNHRQDQARMFELLIRMRQASIHPQLVIEGYRRKHNSKKIMKDWTLGTSSKHSALLKMIDHHPGESSIVFCQFTKEMDILEPLFREKGLEVARLDGSLSIEKKKRVLDKCQAVPIYENVFSILSKQNRLCNLPSQLTNRISSYVKPVDVLLIQIKAGGVGLNLQNFNRIYFTSLDWNPTNEEQAIARAHRMGQRRQVYVKRLILEDSENPMSVIDQRIFNIQYGKRRLAARLLNDDRLLNNGSFKGKRGISRSNYEKLLL